MDRPLLAIAAIIFIVLLGVGLPFGLAVQLGYVPRGTKYLSGTISEVFDDGTVVIREHTVSLPLEVFGQVKVGCGLFMIYQECAVYGERVYYFVRGPSMNGDLYIFRFATEWVK